MASAQGKKVRFPREFFLFLSTPTAIVDPLVLVRAVGKNQDVS